MAPADNSLIVRDQVELDVDGRFDPMACMGVCKHPVPEFGEIQGN
ncbi:MAG: hypothetical protein WBP81_34970 [Solirubrobacteraceae bacterium]